MNPKHLSVRMDRANGEMWLTEEKYRQPIKRIANIDKHVLLCLCADLFSEDGTEEVTREVRFADGVRARITIRDISGEPEEENTDGDRTQSTD
jgi:hypothetical protein